MAATLTSALPAHPGLVSRFFAGLRDAVLLVVNSGWMMKEVEKLNHMSDEQLAAMGTTRVAEVTRIFGSRAI